MKKVDLSLSQPSLTQKLHLIETLWTDLTKDGKTLKSPAWHETVLKDREKTFAIGKVTVLDREQTKKGLRRRSYEDKNPRHS